MIRIAELHANLRKDAACAWTLCLAGQRLEVHSSSSELATLARRVLTIRQAPSSALPSGSSFACAVERCSRAGIRLNTLGETPRRTFQLPGVGTLLKYDAEDGFAVVQPKRGAVFISGTGEMVWLVDDGLLAGEQKEWANLWDIAMIITSEFLRRGGFFLAHAGGVGRAGRCLLLTGESGAGKTTLTTRKTLEGWDFYGDDMVIVGRDQAGQWRIHPFWRPIHLTAHTLDLLGGVRTRSTATNARNKVQCDVTELAPVQPPVAGLIKAVLCLQPGLRGERAPQPLGEAEAMPPLAAALLAGFHLQRADHDLENLLDFLTAIPIYQGSWSTDPHSIDALVEHEDPYAAAP